MTTIPLTDYDRYCEVFRGERLPLAFVDLDRFDANVAYVAATQEHSGKSIRVASKSLRCMALIKRIFAMGGHAYQGILAFTVEEAAHLAANGLDDIMVAYPTLQASDMALAAETARKTAFFSMVVDSRAHLEALAAAGREAGI
ncbi:MAG: amino acid deaminase/aldolase, partial [Deltaproteobacteria bacterium]|nr:amino acid deaminase/aldolase [Deltaproteobacteria bacterium]